MFSFYTRYAEDGCTPIECKLLDFQGIYIGSVGIDLNFLMLSSLSGEERRSFKNSLFNTYYANFSSILAASGVAMKFTLPQLKQEFLEKNFYGLVIGAMITPVILGDPEDAVDLDSFTGEDAHSEYETHRKKLLTAIGKNPLLQPRFLSLLDDMVESGVLKLE